MVEKKALMPEVYDPAEDSFLLESVIMTQDLSGLKCLDMGCGSGVQSAALYKSGAKEVLSVDINPAALKATEEKLQKLGHSAHVLKSDMFTKVKGKYDVIVFNPPYLPSKKIRWLDLDGGKKGRVVIDKFLKQAPAHVEKGGVILLLVSSLNDEKDVKKILEKKGFGVKLVGEEKLFFERLFVLRAVKTK